MQASSEPTHRHFSTPLSQWIVQVPAELPFDAVGLWQIVPVLRQDFGLAGDALLQAVRAAIRALIEAGAIPVQGTDLPMRWVPRQDLAASGERGVELIVEYWQALGRDPHVGDVWLTLPPDAA